MENDAENKDKLTAALDALTKVRAFASETDNRDHARRIFDHLGLMRAKIAERFEFASAGKSKAVAVSRKS